MHQLTNKFMSAIFFGLATIAIVGPAHAVDWKSRSNPLYLYESGVKQGKVYGKFYNDGGVRAMSTTWQYDMKPGGNKVRVETDFSYWRYSTTTCGSNGNTCYVWSDSKQTVETNSAAWVKDARAKNLRSDSSRVRGSINICEIQRWSNDPCSPHAMPSFGY